MRRLVWLALLLPTLASANWEGSVNTDPMTDQIASATASTADTNGQGLLAFKCYPSGSVEMWVIFGKYFSSRDAHQITYRIDDQPAETTGSMASERISGALVTWDVVQEIVPKLKAGNRIMMRAQPYRGASVTLTFSLVGFTAAYETCESVLP